MKLLKGKNLNSLKHQSKPGTISPVFKKMSYLKPIQPNDFSKKTKGHYNDNTPIVNASDAMINFYNFHNANQNHPAKYYCPNGNNDHHKKNDIKFKSNFIAEKEISLIKNRKNDNSQMEALINKSIDYTCYQNSTLLGKSILDFSLNQSKSKKEQSKDYTRPVYISSEEKQFDSSICFKYGSEPIAYKINITQTNNSAAKQDEESLKRKSNVKKSNKKKIINQKQINLMMKTNYINEKSKKPTNQTRSTKNNVLNKKQKSNKHNDLNQLKCNNEIDSKCKLNDYNIYDEEEDKEKIYPFDNFKQSSNNSNTNNILCQNNGHKQNDINLLTQTAKDMLDNNKLKITTIQKEKDNENENIDEDNEIIENDYEDCNVEETSLEDYDPLQTSFIYQFRPISTMNDIIIKTDLQITETSTKYNSIIHKYLFQDTENNLKIQDNSVNNSHLSEIGKDLEEITTVKEKMIQIEQYYSNKINKMKYEMNLLDNSKLKLDDSAIDNSTLKIQNKDNKKEIMNKLDTLEQSLSQKENQYKSTIQSLIDELKEVSKSDININQPLLKEANDLLNEEDYLIKHYSNNKNEANDSAYIHYQLSNGSLISELKRFKKEEVLYKFEIPPRYQMSNRLKCIKEQAIKGKFVRFYENKVIDIIDKKKTIKRVRIGLLLIGFS